MGQQNASNQAGFTVLTGDTQDRHVGSSGIVINRQNEIFLKWVQPHGLTDKLAFRHYAKAFDERYYTLTSRHRFLSVFGEGDQVVFF